MKARLRKDLREEEVLIPIVLPHGMGAIGEEDIENSMYLGYICSAEGEHDGLELLYHNNQIIAVYSIDLDIEEE